MRCGLFRFILVFCIILFSLISCSDHKSGITKEISGVDSLITIAKDSLHSNPIYVKNLAVDELKHSTDSLTYYKWSYMYASADYFLTKYDSVEVITRKIIKYCDKQKDAESANELSALTQNLLGNYYTQMFVPDSAITHYNKALNYFSKVDDYMTEINICINLADANIYKSDYANGVMWYRRAMYITDSIGQNDDKRFPIYSGLGRAYMDLRDFDQSEQYYELAWKYFDNQPLYDKYIYCNNRGNLYYYWQKYEEALPWFIKARNLVLPGNFEFHIHLCGLNLSDVYLHLNNTDSATYYAESSYKYFTGVENASTMYYNTAIRAGIANKTGDFAKAETMFHQTSNPAGIDKDLVSIRNNFYYSFLVRKGDFKQANKVLVDIKTIEDSLRDNRARKRADAYDMQYKTDTTVLRKDLFIAGQKMKVDKLQIQLIIFISCALIVFLATMILLYMLRKKKELQAKEYREKLNQMRLQNIRNRISPHFIFNVLNGIDGNSQEDDKRNLLIKLLRQSLELADEYQITLHQELEFVRSYIELERYNLGETFQLIWEIDQNIDPDKIMVPPLIMQIPVENAIKHALKPKSGERILSITVIKDGNGTSIVITDNGDGVSQSNPKTKGTGTGLKVLLQTIEYMNSGNSQHILYNMSKVPETEGQGTKVTLFIPDTYS